MFFLRVLVREIWPLALLQSQNRAGPPKARDRCSLAKFLMPECWRQKALLQKLRINSLYFPFSILSLKKKTSETRGND